MTLHFWIKTVHNKSNSRWTWNQSYGHYERSWRAFYASSSRYTDGTDAWIMPYQYPRNIALLKAEVPLVQVNQRQKNFLIGLLTSHS